jgi:serine/threonine protein kinase
MISILLLFILDLVKENLGIGSFGAVYLVEDLENGKLKALKVFFKGGEKV